MSKTNDTDERVGDDNGHEVLPNKLAVRTGQGHIDAIIDIEPLWVMVHFLRHERRSAHEGPCLIEILEDERFLDGLFGFLPRKRRSQAEFVYGGLDGRVGELFGRCFGGKAYH